MKRKDKRSPHASSVPYVTLKALPKQRGRAPILMPDVLPSFLAWTHEANDQEVDELEESLSGSFERLMRVAEYSDNPAVRAAAGMAVANLVSSIVKHGGHFKKAVAGRVLKLKEKNSGFKAKWKTLGRQGQTQPKPHHKVLYRFITRIRREIMPYGIYDDVAEDLLGAKREAGTKEVNAKYRKHFRKWATSRIEGLAELRKDFADHEGYWNPQSQIISRLQTKLWKLCSIHFDSLWDELFTPAARPFFASARTNPLQTDKTLCESTEWREAKGVRRVDWAKHESVMKRRAKEHFEL